MTKPEARIRAPFSNIGIYGVALRLVQVVCDGARFECV